MFEFVLYISCSIVFRNRYAIAIPSACYLFYLSYKFLENENLTIRKRSS